MKNPVYKFKQYAYPKGDVTQWFGENPDLYSKNVIIDGVPLRGHNGIDIVRPHGEAIMSTEDGLVVEVKDSPTGYGRHVRIVGDSLHTAAHLEWTYGHLSKTLVKVGDRVSAGQPIGLMGNTGFVVSGATPYWQFNPYAGTHLHLGVRRVRKVTTGGWVYAGTNLRVKVLNYSNGYFGAVDPIDYLLFAEDVPKDEMIRSIQLTTLSLINSLLKLFK